VIARKKFELFLTDADSAARAEGARQTVAEVKRAADCRLEALTLRRTPSVRRAMLFIATGGNRLHPSTRDLVHKLVSECDRKKEFKTLVFASHDDLSGLSLAEFQAAATKSIAASNQTRSQRKAVETGR